MGDVPGSSGGGGGGGEGDDPLYRAWMEELLNPEQFDTEVAWSAWYDSMEPPPAPVDEDHLHQQQLAAGGGEGGVVQHEHPHQDLLGEDHQLQIGKEAEELQQPAPGGGVGAAAWRGGEGTLKQLAVDKGLLDAGAAGCSFLEPVLVLPRGAASPVVASVGFQPGAHAAAAAATGALHAAPGASQTATQREEERRLNAERQKGLAITTLVPVDQTPSFEEPLVDIRRAAAAAATGALHAAPGASQTAIQREEEWRLNAERQKGLAITTASFEGPLVDNPRIAREWMQRGLAF